MENMGKLEQLSIFFSVMALLGVCGYAIGTLNVHNVETLQDVVEATAKAAAQMILQRTLGRAKYVGGDYLVRVVRVMTGWVRVAPHERGHIYGLTGVA